MSTNLLSKKVIIVAVIAVGAVAVFLAAPAIAQATTQQHQKMMMWQGEGMPGINGSVSISNETRDFVNENVNASFVEAAGTAQAQVSDGRVLGGHMGVVQGYLVYTFFVADTANQTGHMIIVDAGNGGVLYISDGQPLGSFDHSMYERGGGYGHGGWHGSWKGHGWGMWR